MYGRDDYVMGRKEVCVVAFTLNQPLNTQPKTIITRGVAGLRRLKPTSSFSKAQSPNPLPLTHKPLNREGPLIVNGGPRHLLVLDEELQVHCRAPELRESRAS